MDLKAAISEVPGIAITVARLGQAEVITKKIRNGKDVTADLLGFLAADLADGVIMRAFDKDSPARRLADGVVDQLAIARVAMETADRHPAVRPYIVILAVRAAFIGAVNGIHLAMTGEVTKGDNSQKLVSLASAALGLSALTGNRKATHIAGLVTSGIVFATTPRYLKGLGKSHSGSIRNL